MYKCSFFFLIALCITTHVSAMLTMRVDDLEQAKVKQKRTQEFERFVIQYSQTIFDEIKSYERTGAVTTAFGSFKHSYEEVLQKTIQDWKSQGIYYAAIMRALCMTGVFLLRDGSLSEILMKKWFLVLFDGLLSNNRQAQYYTDHLFIEAARYGRQEIVEWLLAKGARLEGYCPPFPDLPEANVRPTALYWAIRFEQVSIVQFLRERGARDPWEQSYFISPS